MQTIGELFHAYSRDGIRQWVDNSQPNYRTTSGKLPSEFRGIIQQENRNSLLEGPSFDGYLEPVAGLALALVLSETSKSVVWTIQHDPLHFEDSTVESVSKSLTRTINQVTLNLNALLSRLPSPYET